MKMDKSNKPNISPLEAEIESKLAIAYLYGVAAPMQATYTASIAANRQIQNDHIKTPVNNRIKPEYDITQLFEDFNEASDKHDRSEIFKK